MTDVSICIPTYAGGRRLERLLTSFRDADVDPYYDELLVFDDGSSEGEAAIICDAFQASHLTAKALLRDGQNYGYTGAVAKLVAASSRETVLLLDDDTVLPSGFMHTLRIIVAALPGVGALSWRSLGPHEAYDSRRAIPGFLEPATHLAGYCMAFRRSVYDEVGGVDTRFRAFCGDSDLALRMTLAGHPSYRVWWPLVPHEGGASSKGSMALERPSAGAARDLALWAEKWDGKSGPEMERIALERLVQKANA